MKMMKTKMKMKNNMYYDKDGVKIDLMTWAKLLEDGDYKIIKQDKLPDGKMVSTVWLGLDQSYADGPILIFETMVFGPKKEKIIFGKKHMLGDELDIDRYSTLREAKIGHERMLIKYTKNTSLWKRVYRKLQRLLPWLD
jgi:hypothetical protein